MSELRHVLTILAVEDLAASAAFYRAAFGWSAAVDTPVYVEFAVGAQRVGIYERHGFGRNVGQVPLAVPTGGVGPAELYFHSDAPEAAIARLRAAGARELSGWSARPWGDHAAYFADPSGHVLVVARPSSTVLAE